MAERIPISEDPIAVPIPSRGARFFCSDLPSISSRTLAIACGRDGMKPNRIFRAHAGVSSSLVLVRIFRRR